MEKLTAAAIKMWDAVIVWKRHGNAMWWFSSMFNFPTKIYTDSPQWFWTSKHRFVDRKEAFILAKENWQLDKKERDRKDDDLYSEDLR